MTHFFRVWLQFLRSAFVRQMEFRGAFIVDVSISLLWLCLIYLTAELFYLHTTDIAGWSKAEVYVLITSWACIQELFNAFFWPGLSRLSETIHSGDFDSVLTRPVHAIWQLAFSRLSVPNLIQGAVYVVILVVLLVQIETSVWRIVAFLGLCAAAVVIAFSLMLAMQTIAFWFIRVENVRYLYFSLVDIGRYPASVYGRAIAVMYTVLPVAYLGNIQAEVLLGKAGWGSVVLTLVAAAVAALGSFLFYSLGARRYGSASS